jgi:hypothetical protein
MQVVVIPAGVPRKPGMTRDDLFNTNGSIVSTNCLACHLRLDHAQCPCAAAIALAQR